MLLQAHSVEQFVVDPTIHYIYIEDDAIPLREWESLLIPIYKRHQVVLIYQQLNLPNLCGYFQQQYLKLALSSKLSNEYILSLDSKNVFCKNINLHETFYGNDGGSSEQIDIHTTHHEWASYYMPWINIVERLTNSKSPKQRFPSTPFVFKNSSLKKMNTSVNIKQLFTDEIANTVTKPSEYLLYNFFNEDSGEARWWSTENGVFTVFRRDLEDSPGYREETRKFLIDCGLDPIYVNPAVDLTSQHNR